MLGIKSVLRPLLHEWRRATYLSAQKKSAQTDADCLIPISLTTLGRSGSSVILGHLACHPEISVFSPFSGEAHYLTYFSQIIKTLSSQNSFLFPIQSGNTYGIELLKGDAEVAAQFNLTEDHLWFQYDYLPKQKQFYLDRLSELYRWKKRGSQPEGMGPLFMCEKFLPSGPVELVQEIFPQMKEVVLVRDFRDILCSVLAFNDKRGFDSFGAEKFSSTEDYVRRCLAPSVEILLKRWNSVKGQACLIRYEDFILEREKLLGRVFAYLGTEFCDVQAVIDLAKKTQSDNQRQLHVTTNGVAESVARYERDLSPDLIELCNDVMKEPLLAFGYTK